MGCSFYDYAYADGEQTFTNTSGFEEIHTLDFTAPALGDYLILVSFYLTLSTSNGIGAMVQLDDTITIMEGAHQPQNSPAYDYKNYSTMYLAESLSSGAHNIDIDTVVTEGTGYIIYAKIIVFRIDDWFPTSGMYAYDATEGETSLNTSYSTLESITFTPDSAGDYLVLASCEVHSDSTTKSTSVRLDYDSAAEYLPIQTNSQTYEHATFECTHTNDYFPWVWGGIINIPASSKTIILQGASTSSGDARKRRIIALRLGAMSSSPQTNEDTTETTTRAWASKATKTWTPSAQLEHLILCGLCLRPAATSEEGRVQFNHSAGTSPGVFSFGQLDAKDVSGPADYYPFFSCVIKDLGAISQTFDAEFAGRLSNDDVFAKAGFIVIIDIEEVITYKLEGITKDNSGSVLVSCECWLVKDNLDDTFSFVAFQVSDGATGAYSFTGLTDNDAQYQILSVKDGTPVMDCTDKVLQPVVE